MFKRIAVIFIATLIFVSGVNGVSALERYEYLMLGDKDKYVLELQKELFSQKYLNVKPTGYFGTDTQEALLSFQRANRISADAKAGPQTRKLLLGDKFYDLPADRIAATPNVSPQTLREGDRGDGVTRLQEQLKNLGYYTYEKITGFFGPITGEALKAFQKRNGLLSDGIAGDNTQAKLKDNPSANIPETGDAPVPPKPSAGDIIDTFIANAKTKLNCKYVWSDEGPNTFDCSGLLYYTLRSVGIAVRRTTAAGYSAYSQFKNIASTADLAAGDLVFFRSNSSARVSHTGIYLGGGKVLHASSGAGKVIISSMSGYFTKNFVNARRFV